MTARQGKALRWHHAALDDLVEIIEYIATDSPRAAERLGDAIVERIERLRDHPYAGETCPHYKKARQLVHGKYVIYHTVHRTDVVIRAIVHGARQFRSSWLKRPE
jgi:addiction module RelE/StbE family toxin